ncbi:MAG: outer membrane beta-barrel protein [Woeseiaceae bacterium]
MTPYRILLIAALLLAATTAHAQRFNTKKIHEDARTGSWEVSLLAQQQGSADVTGERGSSAEIDSELGWGFTIGYNLTANWNFQYKFTLVKPDYRATLVPEPPEDPEEEAPGPQTFDWGMTKYAHALNATYHFSRGPLTPFLQLGAGFVKLDSNVVRDVVTGCWWDPWWGYICDSQLRTYESSGFAYNAGLGLRWDFNPSLFLRGSYNREWIDTDAGGLDFDTLSLEFGLMW